MFKSDIINLDVDTSNDFILPDGNLYVQKAESIINNIKALRDNAFFGKRVILSPTDAHYGTRDRACVEGEELGIYGSHCIKGTIGAEKISESLITEYITVPSEKIAPLVLKEVVKYQQIILEKQGIDVFYSVSNQAGNQNIDDILELLKVKTVIVYGVVSHICVEKAAIGALNRGIAVCIVEDAIKEIDPVSHQEFKNLMLKNGARFVTTKQVNKWFAE